MSSLNFRVRGKGMWGFLWLVFFFFLLFFVCMDVQLFIVW